MLDTFVTLIVFLLFTMSFLSLGYIRSPFPVVSPEEVKEKLKTSPLQLTVSVREGETEIWSPFQKFHSITISHNKDGNPDVFRIHEEIVKLKQAFPEESTSIFTPHKDLPYDQLVSVMDSMRLLQKTDPPIYVENQESHNKEESKMLFPDLVFANLLGD